MSDQTDKSRPKSHSFDPVAAIAGIALLTRAPARRPEADQHGAMPSLGDRCKCRRMSATPSLKQMFGVSSTTVSHIAHCIDRRPGTIWRYPAVFVEWRRLGEDGFIRTYMTEDLYLKAKRLKYEIPELAGR